MIVACSRAGVSPSEFWEMTFREVFAVLKGEKERLRERRMLAIFEAWHAAAFARQRRLPDLASILRKMEPSRVMSNREVRSTIFAIAAAMGAKVRYVKKTGD